MSTSEYFFMLTTIIFDFDGVFTKDEYRCMRRICADEKLLETLESPYYIRPSSTQLWSDLRNAFHFTQSDQEAIDLYNLEDDEQRAYKLEMLAYAKSLVGKFSLFLLSNQVTDRTSFLRRNEDLSMFDAVFFSDELALRKPDLQVYKEVLIRTKKQASECLFVDDCQENILAAKKVGMNIHLFKDCESLSLQLATLT